MGRLQESVVSFNNAIKFNQQAIRKRDISNVHKCLGVVLKRQWKSLAAIDHLKKATEGFAQQMEDNPKSLQVCENLAGSYVALAEVNEDTENSKGATSAWRGAVKIYNYAARLDPADVNYHVEAIKALLHAGEFPGFTVFLTPGLPKRG